MKHFRSRDSAGPRAAVSTADLAPWSGVYGWAIHRDVELNIRHGCMSNAIRAMKEIRFFVLLLICWTAPLVAAPRFSYECDATYLANLYWTVSNLTDPNSEYSKYWERKFGFSAEDREALDKLGQTLQRLRGRYKVWESDSVLTPLASGPMVGLFMAPMSSYEQRVQVAMATSSDLGTVRGKMPDLSFTETNTIAGTCGRFLGKFDSIWEGLSRTPTQSATRVTALLQQNEQKVDEFASRSARVYGVTPSPPAPLPRAGEGGGVRVRFKAHFLWSPRQVGGQCTLVENHIFCETSEREDPQRYLLGLLHETCHYLSASVASPTKYRRSEAMLENGIYFPLRSSLRSRWPPHWRKA